MHILLPKSEDWRHPMRPSVKSFRHLPAKDEYNGLVMDREMQPHFGRFGLQVLEDGWITSRQMEVLRRALVTAMERRGKVYMRAFPHQVITQRIATTRVGASMGNIEYWVAAVRKYFVLIEIDGVNEDTARRAFRQAARELPIKCRMVMKEYLPEEFELGGYVKDTHSDEGRPYDRYNDQKSYDGDRRHGGRQRRRGGRGYRGGRGRREPREQVA